MGQYYFVVNLDKGEFIHPHRMNNGLKLLEFGCSRYGTLTGLGLLLADGNGRGGGDIFHTIANTDNNPLFDKLPAFLQVEHEFTIPAFEPPKPPKGVRVKSQKKAETVHRTIVPKIVGRWAGDRIVIAGDYADEGKFLTPEQIAEYQAKGEQAGTDSDGNQKIPNLHSYAGEFFKDISHDILLAMSFDPWLRPYCLETLQHDLDYKFDKGKIARSARATMNKIKKAYGMTAKDVEAAIAELHPEKNKTLKPDMVIVAKG